MKGVLKRFQIPPVRKALLTRKRLIRLLSEAADYPVTVVQAGAGFGKTTAVSTYAHQETLPVRWLTLTEEEREPAHFVLRFVEAILPRHISHDEMESIKRAVDHPLTWASSAVYVARLIGKYSPGDIVLIFDDFHVIDNDSAILEWMHHWLEQVPYHIHVIIVTRSEPNIGYLATLETRGEVLRIREADLAFTEQEIAELFGQGHPWNIRLTPLEVEWLMDKTEGMAIALSLLWREWKQCRTFDQLQTLFETGSTMQEQLGRLLTSGLSEEVFKFFVRTSILTVLTPEVCDFVLERQDSASMLEEGLRKGVLSLREKTLHEKAPGYTLHPLVREFLQQCLNRDERTRVVRRVVDWFYQQGEVSRAIGYLFAVQDEARIVSELLSHIPAFLQKGQLSTVDGWLNRLSEETLSTNPELLYAKAEISRYKNQYQEATRLYQQALQAAECEGNVRMQVLCMLGLAKLYLDTIQPSLADKYIRAANQRVRMCKQALYDLRLQLLHVTYENAINDGRVVRAQRLQKSLRHIDSTYLETDNSDARLLLRSGRLQQAALLLSSRVSGKEDGQRTALSHREATLILSLLESMLGNAARARDLAVRGTQVGDELDSPFVRAVGLIRLGHAQHLADPLSSQALESYETAIQLMDELAIVRGKAEAMMGVCLVHAYRGQYEMMKASAEEGISIARGVRDFWMETLVRLAYGQGCVVNGRADEAVVVLTLAEQISRLCHDPFLRLCSLLWRSLAWRLLEDHRQHTDLHLALELAQAHNAEFVMTKATYFGVRDVHALAPLLRKHSQLQSAHRLADRVLEQIRGDELEHHPGYTLRVQTLGGFRVWRGFSELTRKDWQREKARQLFQFLITRKGVSMHREEIAFELWGIDDPNVAERDFKVALNVLSQALEPNKAGRGTTAFIERDGAKYQLICHPILVIDKDVFEERVKLALSLPKPKQLISLRQALELYQGEYLPDAKYESWSENERERLKALFLKTGLAYGEAALYASEFDEAVTVAERMVETDASFEPAYVLLMKAYARQYRKSMVVQTFRRCQDTLRKEFGVDVMPTTVAVYKTLVGDETL